MPCRLPRDFPGPPLLPRLALALDCSQLSGKLSGYLRLFRTARAMKPEGHGDGPPRFLALSLSLPGLPGPKAPCLIATPIIADLPGVP